MPVTVICYPPGGGGNHLKNIISLDERFHDQWPWDWAKTLDLHSEVYVDDPDVMAGTVHALRGRNIHEVFFDHIESQPHDCYLLQGHFGELAKYLDRIKKINNINWILITLDHAQDRHLLDQRQHRLGQNNHPYWLEEEQPYLYQDLMCESYFRAQPQNILNIPLREFWNRDLAHYNIISRINAFLQIDVCLETAQTLHDHWHRLNFAPNDPRYLTSNPGHVIITQ
jgi:hypothetical protein